MSDCSNRDLTLAKAGMMGMSCLFLVVIAMFATVVGCGEDGVATGNTGEVGPQGDLGATGDTGASRQQESAGDTSQNAEYKLDLDSFRDCKFLPVGFEPLERGSTFLETHFLELMVTGYRKQRMRVLFFAATNQLLARMRSIDRSGRSLYLPQHRSRFEDYCLDELSQQTLLPYAIATVGSGHRRVTSQQFGLLQQEFAEDLGVYWDDSIRSGAAKLSQTMSDWLGKQNLIYASTSNPEVISRGDNHIAIHVASATVSSGGGRVRVTMQATVTLLNIGGTLVTIYTYSKPSDASGLRNFARWIDNLVERLG